MRTSIVDDLVSTLSVWYLELDSELVFVGDGGTRSERHGIEFTNLYTPKEWLSVYADYAYTHPRFKNDTGER